MNRFEFYKEIFFNEFERQKNLNDLLNIPITIITGLLLFLFYGVTNFDFSISTVNAIVFLFLVLSSFISLIISSWFLILSFSRVKKIPKKFGIEAYHKYYFLPPANKSEEYRKGNKLTEEQYEEYLIEHFVSGASENSIINKEKSWNLWRAKKALAFAITFSLLTVIPFLYNHFSFSKPEHQQIQIINPVKLEPYEKSK